MEIWKNVLGYEDYEVSNLGRVKSLKFGKDKILKLSDDGNGYLKVCLFNNKKQKVRKVHQLVAEAFLNHIPCGFELVVNHKNFTRTDNRPNNLEITSQRNNANLKHIKSSSKYTGVCWNKRANKWTANITINKKLKHLGNFKLEIEAHNAYQNALNSLCSA